MNDDRHNTVDEREEDKNSNKGLLGAKCLGKDHDQLIGLESMNSLHTKPDCEHLIHEG